MKKILSAVLAAIVMASVLTGCNNTPNESNDSNNSSSSSANPSSSSSESSSSSSSESSSSSSSESSSSSSSESSSSSSSSESSSSTSSSSTDSSSSSSSNESSSSENSSSSTPVESQPSGGYDTSNTYGLELPNSRAGELAAKILAADSFGNIGVMEEFAVGLIFSEDLELDMLEDYCFLFPKISVGKMMLYIAKPKPENEAAVKAIFDEKYDFYKNDPNAMNYLTEQADVAGTVSGVTSDGYYYIIVHKNGQTLQNLIA